MKILLAILLGTLFGFILARIGAADPDKIFGMLRLTDPHLARTILLGIGSSSVLLVFGLVPGLVDPGHIHVKALYIGIIPGGILFGIGWALSGFCPGTGVVALGTGRRDAAAFVLGGLAGTALYLVSFGILEKTSLFDGIMGGKISLAELGNNPALIHGPAGKIVAVALGLVLIVVAFRLPGTTEES